MADIETLTGTLTTEAKTYTWCVLARWRARQTALKSAEAWDGHAEASSAFRWWNAAGSRRDWVGGLV